MEWWRQRRSDFPVNSMDDLSEQIRNLINAGRYRIRLHAVRHMIEEGFDERNLLEAASGTLRVVEEYPAESRCLVLGYFHFTPGAASPLHIVCDLSDERLVDIVTAYIPQSPWWRSPTQRERKK
jgi:hypothetical protein